MSIFEIGPLTCFFSFKREISFPKLTLNLLLLLFLLSPTNSFLILPFFWIVIKNVKFHKSPYTASLKADAIVILTEWEEFKILDYDKIYCGMQKPAFLFDGRLMMDAARLREIGFRVQVIGKRP